MFKNRSVPHGKVVMCHVGLKKRTIWYHTRHTVTHIESALLSFPGATAGGFNFQVNDGVNFAPRQIFSVTARALVLHMERSGPLKVFPGNTAIAQR